MELNFSFPLRESGGVTRELFDLCHRIRQVDDTLKQGRREEKERIAAQYDATNTNNIFLNFMLTPKKVNSLALVKVFRFLREFSRGS